LERLPEAPDRLAGAAPGRPEPAVGGSPKRGTDAVRTCCETRARATEKPYLCAFCGTFRRNRARPGRSRGADDDVRPGGPPAGGERRTRRPWAPCPAARSDARAGGPGALAGHAARALLRPRGLRGTPPGLPRRRAHG